MAENNENKHIIMGGVSGNKELRVRRVHKKKADGDAAAAAPKTDAPKAEAAKPAEAPKAETPKAEAPKKEAAKTEAPKAETKKTEAVKAETPKTEAPKKAAPKSSEKAVEKKTEAPKKEAPKAESEKKPEKKADAKTETKPEAKPAETKKEQAKPDRTKISSAVIAMPGTVRTSTYVDRRQNTGRPQAGRPYGNRSTDVRSSDYRSRNSQGGNGGRSGGYQNGGRSGGYTPKDKDDDSSSRQPQRRVSKPKTSGDDTIEEVKKVRANFAERSAFDKKKNENYESKKDNNKSKGNMNDSRYRGKRVDDMDDEFDEYSHRRKKNKNKASFSAQPVVEKKITDIQLPPFITVKEFAEGIEKKSSEVITALMKLGMMATINQELDFDTAAILADSFGIKAEPITEVTEEDILFDESEGNPENMKPRPPVVVVMGHVDHGKTSLLDRFRSTSVVSGEAGGITQHIGAYTVRLKGRQITFLDTPGHEAFTTMRARGAQVTDIAILVVAADDGVMPQTIEAIHHAKDAGTEIIVAINKMDKPGANPDKVKQELANYELIPEEWGGSTIMVPVSAKTGEGIDDLLDMVLLTADVMELKADPTSQAKGTVIEAKLDKGRGPVATILVDRGTLKQGDSVVCGAMIGNVRAMVDDKGKAIKKAGPSVPVEVLGLPEVPNAGDVLYAVDDEKIARQLVEKRKIQLREQQLHKSSRMSLESLAQSMAEGDVKNLNIIIKADVQGSVEAVTQSLERLTNDEVHVKVVHGAVGAINESDILLADVSNAIIIGFNVRPNAIITEKAKEVGVDIRLYSVIYNAIEDVESAMKGLLAPKFEEVVLGHVEIRELFKVSGVGTIGGAYVTDGKITRNSDVRVVRDDVVIYTGHLGSLQRMKDAVKEVQSGFECGLSVENYNDIKIGDTIEAFEMQEVAR